jgi:DNA-binding NarL/FixJ family response regulator
MRVLIVDDNELVRRALRDLVSNEAGCAVCGEAADGQQAFEKARELRPDLILLDLSMPATNGFELSKRIREELPSARILIVSQQDADLVLPSALQAGADGCVDKARIVVDLLPVLNKLRSELSNNASQTAGT